MDEHPSPRQREPALFSNFSYETTRALCMSAGDWSMIAAAEVERVLTEKEQRRPESYAEGVDELARRGAITSKDAGALKKLIKAVLAATRGRDARPQILQIYSQLCADRDSSPAALAIASTAVRALERPRTTSAPEPGGTARAEVNVGAAVTYGVAGALIGAGIGAGFGGAIGAGIGGLIGGAVGAGISVSNDLGI